MIEPTHQRVGIIITLVWVYALARLSSDLMDAFVGGRFGT
jgi:hypothetical protein